MSTKAFVVSALVAVAQARFSQEQAVAGVIGALSNFGNPGEAATLAGASPGVLLAAADPCNKLTLADKIVTQLGTDPAVIAAAAKLVGAEQNFNPFVVSIPNICGDASLPATAELRGIVPLVDPAVGGSDIENANAAKSLVTPFAAVGLSVADVMKANGFGNFSVKGVAAGSAAATTAAAAATTAAAVASSAANTDCAVPQTITKTVIADAAATAASSAAPAATSAAASSGSAGGVQQSTIAGLDFGLCVPTIKREAGLNGRKETEFTFQAIDVKINSIQQEALNPNIITNRICDELTNQCQANAAAKSACLDAKAQILALGTRDDTTANKWNELLGFAGTNLNPDNAPRPGLKGQNGQ